MASEREAPSIKCLPDSVLARIFELARKEHGPSICGVCKSWNSLFFQIPGLWRTLRLDYRRVRLGQMRAWLGAQPALLARLGPLVVAADVQLEDPGYETYYEGLCCGGESEEQSDGEEGEGHSDGEAGGDGEAGNNEGGGKAGGLWEPTNALLQALPPGLSELRLSLACDEEGATALALPSLPHLSCLHLHLPLWAAAVALQPAVAAWLAQLPRLQAFSWHGPAADLSPQLAGVLGGLSGLTALELRVSAGYAPADGQLPPNAGAAIAALTALRALTCEAAPVPLEVAAAAAGLPHLTALSLIGLPPSAPLAQLTVLAQLRQLSLDVAPSADAPLELPAPAAFPFLAHAYPTARGTAESGQLVLNGLRRLRSWAELLRVLRPPAGNAPLRTLSIEFSELPEEALQGCPPLPDLAELHLDSCTGGAGGEDGAAAAPLSAAAASALLRAAPRLEALAITSCLRDECPEALAAARGLTLLDLTANHLTNLPPGAWLADLKALALSSNCFESLPPALAGATALTALELSGNWQLYLKEADADMLSPLRQLARISFAAAGSRVSAAFRQRMAAQLPDKQNVMSTAMQTSRRRTR